MDSLAMVRIWDFGLSATRSHTGLPREGDDKVGFAF